ncbi:Serine/arginine-rich splicing factor 6 [Coemansia sp. RSA 2671]|uniref:Serine/arginine-rich splicing factor 6 n=1 Tax=Coemansia linderi TaxID=2663919 RepID=A0ACC1KPT5_9FUNG|nr:Serine/arginine-rich splicing factor 6 [Coemansia sp. RSA 2675]KAJ2345317.1 Serine/arginine-rich splicing factor 6 [Coemansia sp. RSA 2671]KAJ2381466.1 Serine/arginine-rich splicing factor 6 [Coemansia sp. RSA 2611]KAJ2792834.1 Serine/arginine-rich splicing factor 6 [Coemansia linderi]
MSRLYVGRLPRDVRERDIERLFKGYGQIRDICLLSGFGFVEFRDRRDAEDVMHDFNNREFMGERLLIEPARVDRRRERGFGGPDGSPGFGGPGRRDDRGDDRGRRMGPSSAPQRTPYRMLVDNLSSSVSWQDLKDFARRAGEVSFADAHKLRPGEGIVEFIDESGLRTALRKLDGEDLRGRRVTLREDTGARGSYGGGGGNGGGRPPRDRSFSPRRGAPRDRSFSPRRQERERSRSFSPGYRRSSYRSRSPVDRRMSPGRRQSSRSRSPRGGRSRSPMGGNGLPPPPHQPMGRSSMSPRSPDMVMAGEPEPEQHAGNGGWE